MRIGPKINIGRSPVNRKPTKLYTLARQTGASPYGSKENWKKLGKACKQKAKYICSGCGENFSKRRHLLHPHHKVSVFKGGSNTLDNLVCLCKDCHEKEHAHMSKRKKRK